MSEQSRRRRKNSKRVSPLTRLWRLATQRFTIMLIPHSERGVVNFHVNALALVFGAVLFAGVLGGFVYLSSIHIGSTAIVDQQDSRLTQSQANFDAVLSEVQALLQAAEGFDEELVETVTTLGVEVPDGGDESGVVKGDLAAFDQLQVVQNGAVPEVQELQDLAQKLSDAVQPLQEMRGVLQAQAGLLQDLPNFWPVENGRGVVTMEFGPNIHPITSQWYLHKGFDIAGTPGLPVVASGNGKVVELGFDPGYGFYVWLRHKYGFRTRYSHMQAITVSEGEEIAQGQRIGTLGNSGISTGPHLDFQIWLGTDVVDPAVFLKISNSFNRWSGNR